MKHKQLSLSLISALLMVLNLGTLTAQKPQSKSFSPKLTEGETPNFTFTADGSIKNLNFTVRTANESRQVKVKYPDGKVVTQTSDDEYGIARFFYTIKDVAAPWTVEIYTDEIESFTSQYTGIIAVNPINVPKMIRLTLPYQNVKELDLTKIPKLQELYLQHCAKLNVLDLTGCNNLQMLNVGNDDQLEVKGLESCTSLKTIVGYGSSLKNVDFSKLVNLVKLDLTNNGLTSVNLSTNSKLEVLELASNKLTDVDLSHLSSLKVLKISSNKIAKLDLSELKNLEEVDVSDNGMVSFKISRDKLHNFDCSKNNLSLDQLIEKGKLAVYLYTPQYPFPVKKTVRVGQELDLSSMAYAKGELTTEAKTEFAVLNSSSELLKEGEDYTMNEGRFTFNKPAEGLKFRLVSAAFPQLKGDSTMYSAPFNVLAQDAPEPQIVSFPDNAFKGSNLLEKIYMPKNVEHIGAHAFEDCPNLCMIAFSTDAETFGEAAFPDQNLKIYVSTYEIKRKLDEQFKFEKTQVVVGVPESIGEIVSLSDFRLLENELIITPNDTADIRIYSLDGQLVSSASVSASESHVFTLESGFYLVQINNKVVKIYIK